MTTATSPPTCSSRPCPAPGAPPASASRDCGQRLAHDLGTREDGSMTRSTPPASSSVKWRRSASFPDPGVDMRPGAGPGSTPPPGQLIADSTAESGLSPRSAMASSSGFTAPSCARQHRETLERRRCPSRCEQGKAIPSCVPPPGQPEIHLLETFEAGIQSTGTEAKALRAGRTQLREGYVSIEHGEAWRSRSTSASTRWATARTTTPNAAAGCCSTAARSVTWTPRSAREG